MTDRNGKIVVLMTADDSGIAERIARALVERRLAACVSVFPKGISLYRWKGAIETAKEHLVVAKTSRRLLGELVNLVKTLHGYEVPEVIALPIEGGNADYLAWLESELKGEEENNA